MSLILTYWEDPPNKVIEDDFDGILEVTLKSVKQIPDLIAAKPSHCTMISLEYSGDHRKNGKISNPQNPHRFREIWRKSQPLPDYKPKKCPLCGHTKI